jgi:hypothetical protein
MKRLVQQNLSEMECELNQTISLLKHFSGSSVTGGGAM